MAHEMKMVIQFDMIKKSLRWKSYYYTREKNKSGDNSMIDSEHI